MKYFRFTLTQIGICIGRISHVKNDNVLDILLHSFHHTMSLVHGSLIGQKLQVDNSP